MKSEQKPRAVYVCPECHSVAFRPKRHHGQPMVKCDAGLPGDERSKPLLDQDGQIRTRAPRWWVETCVENDRARARGAKQARRKTVQSS